MSPLPLPVEFPSSAKVDQPPGRRPAVCSRAPRRARLWRVAALCVAGVSLLARAEPPSALSQRAAATLPSPSETLAVRGLEQPVRVVRDIAGIAHIYAENTHDLFFAQGYVAAQDHLFQMELWRRANDGALAEVLGPDYVEQDIRARALAFRGDWATELDSYHPESRTILEAYANGINAAIAVAVEENRVPLEFTLAGFAPQPVWVPQTFLSRLSRWDDSEAFARVLARRAEESGVTLPESGWWNAAGQAGAIPERIKPLPLPPPPRSFGPGAGGPVAKVVPPPIPADMSWTERATFTGTGELALVVGPEHSTSSAPLLAAAVDAGFAFPATRYLVHLVAPGWNVIGLAEPARPGIGVGHNAMLAWAEISATSSGFTLQEVETNPADSHEYLEKGAWVEMRRHTELIQLKTDRFRPRQVTLKYTSDGLVVHEDIERHVAFVLGWDAFQIGQAEGVAHLRLMQARSGQDLTPGSTVASLPAQAVVAFAETDGAAGVHSGAGGEMVAALPHGGRAVLTGGEMAGYRLDRIRDVFDGAKNLSVADMVELLGDRHSALADALLPLLTRMTDPRRPVLDSLEILARWDRVMATDSVAATLYEFWWAKTKRKVEQLSRPVVGDGAMGSGAIVRLLREPDARFGPDPTAGRDALMRSSLEEALFKLEGAYGADRTRWTWGRIHRAMLVHPLLAEATADGLFIPAIAMGGDHDTVDQTLGDGTLGASRARGAAAQLVMDPGDWDRSVALLVPGNVSQVGSPYATNLLASWQERRPFPLPFSAAAVGAAAAQEQRLYPWVEYQSEDSVADFRRTQPELFLSTRPVTQVWGDYDNDGWPDLFVGYQGGVARLFHNERGHFDEVTLASGIADWNLVRSAAWGDFDGDGNLDLYVGFGMTSTRPNRLYQGDGSGHFTDVASKWGIMDAGESRQIAFVDFNNDGRSDLFVAFREKANRLYRNDGDTFTEVSAAMGISGPQSTVGGVWFDYNEDGRLDLFLANQNGSLNRVYRNDGERFTEVAAALGVDGAGRTSVIGSVGIAIGDYNRDGRLDLYFANYGPSWLMRNDGSGNFTNVAAEMGVLIDKHLVAAGWGDFDNDGLPDLYTCGYLSGHPNVRDYLLHNEGTHFSDVTPGYMLKFDSDHGVAWADFDRDGALDLALCDHEATGVVSLYHNQLPPDQAARSLQILVLDAKGSYTMAGSEVRVFTAGTREPLGAALVDSGSGYSSQSALPVHFGLPERGLVDVEITSMSNSGRVTTRVKSIDPRDYVGDFLTVKIEP